MRLRSLLRIAVCILTPILILACSVVFTGGNFHRWVLAQRDVPLLWLVDFTAVYTFLLLIVAIGNWEKSALREKELNMLRQEHLRQLEALIAQAAELDRENNELNQKFETFTTGQGQEHFVLEEEAAKLAEQAFRAIQAQIEGQSRQLEAVNLALQHHRAEIGQLRHSIKVRASDADVSHLATLTTSEYIALTAAPIPASVEREPLRVIQPQRYEEPDTPSQEDFEFPAQAAVSEYSPH